jgi:LPXTG-motif cell wall-anchored protein
VSEPAPSDGALLREGGVEVTADELRADGAVHALADTTAVEVVREPAPVTGPVLMLATGAMALLAATGEAGLAAAAIGVLLLAGGALWWTRKRPSFKLQLRSADDEITALEDRDEARVRRVARAVEEARERAHQSRA